MIVAQCICVETGYVDNAESRVFRATWGFSQKKARHHDVAPSFRLVPFVARV